MSDQPTEPKSNPPDFLSIAIIAGWLRIDPNVIHEATEGHQRELATRRTSDGSLEIAANRLPQLVDLLGGAGITTESVILILIQQISHLNDRISGLDETLKELKKRLSGSDKERKQLIKTITELHEKAEKKPLGWAFDLFGVKGTVPEYLVPGVSVLLVFALGFLARSKLFEEQNKNSKDIVEIQAEYNRQLKEQQDSFGREKARFEKEKARFETQKIEVQRLAASNVNLQRSVGELNEAKAEAMSSYQSMKLETSNLASKLAENEARTEEMQARSSAMRQAIESRNDHIAKLDSENSKLVLQVRQLNASIAPLERSVGETERKLVAQEGDREFLLKELKRLQAEKADLELNMRDLAFLREQVSQLKSQLNVARRLDWIRRGVYSEKKGSQLMAENSAFSSGGSDVEAEGTRDNKIIITPK